MSWKTCRGFVSSAERIKKLELIPLIYGIRTSGARAKYIRKEDFPKLAGLTESGYAKDIYLRKDKQKKRIIIQDERIFEDKDAFDNYVDGEGELVGKLESGRQDGSGAALADMDKNEKVIVWFNGRWVIIKKYPVGTWNGNEIKIPIEPARDIITDAKHVNNGETINDTSIMNSLPKSKEGDSTFESVPVKQLAEQLQSYKDIFSYWTFDGILNVMINTHMRYGPYKLQRTNHDINVHMAVDFKNANKDGQNNKRYIDGIPDNDKAYQTEILNGFNK